jgi:hypothetical protein
MSTPLEGAKIRLRPLKLEVEGMINLLTSPTALSDSRTTVSDLIASELGGAISLGLLGRRRPGQTLARNLSRQSRINQRQQLLAASRSRALGILQQMEFELSNLAGQMNESRRRALLRSLAQVRSSPSPATIGRRIARVISEIESTSSVPETLPPGIAQPESAADHSLLRQFEQDLRGFISGQLSGVSANWWLESVPSEVRKSAEQRLRSRETTWPWTPGVESTAIHYVDFSDYAKILVFGQNWTTVFGRFFGDPDIVRSKLRELEPIRNDVAHSRTLSEEGRTKLRLYAGELSRMMREGPYSQS